MFPCNKCGACCRNLDKSDLYAFLNRGDGICIYLKGNGCSIYDKRPLLCRIDEYYDRYFSKFYTIEEYYELNRKVCKSLQEKEGE